MAKQKIFTPADRQNILREIVQKDIQTRLQKEMEKLLKEPDFWDDCPYCGELADFKNDENARKEKIGKSDYLVMKCPKCGKEVYHFLKVVQNGDMLNGITYDPVVRVMTKEYATMTSDDSVDKPQKTRLIIGRFRESKKEGN